MVKLKVFNIIDKEIATLLIKQKSAERYEVRFNAFTLATGMYMYKIQAGNFNQVRKMMLIK
jgi:hypothetical protein